jgi:hypothetical protein
MAQDQEEVKEPKLEMSATDEGLVIEGDREAVTAQVEQIANDDLEAGFRKARREEETPDEADQEVDVNTELTALRKFQTEATDKLDKATKKIQSLEGFKGSIKQQIDQGVTRALALQKETRAAAPTN